MLRHYKLIFISFYLLCAGCHPASKLSSSTATLLKPSDLQPYGRSVINSKQELELIGSAVHFGFSFRGNECQLLASLPSWMDHNYLQYELDGVYQKRIKISGKETKPIILSAPTDGKHTVWIYKATEAHTGAVIIQKIIGMDLQVLKKSSAPVIEFIGNSITCGAAADASEIPCNVGEYHDHHNAYDAYGPRVGRALKINYFLSSVSGIGIYRNWNSDGPTMPQVYEKLDMQERTAAQWNFKTYTPAIVSIALGTNDFSTGDGKKSRAPFDTSAFINNYVKFVQLVKSKYPAAQIALLSSPMVNGESRTTLQNCLMAVKKNVDALYSNDKKLAFYFFEPMRANGCGGHPSVEDHAIMAKELIPFFKKLLP